MCVNFLTPCKAKRAAARFRRRFDSERNNQYTIVQGTLYATRKIVYHVAVWSARGVFLTYV